MTTQRRDQIMRFLHANGAQSVEHLHGSLLEHLERTEALLHAWGCSDTVAFAGLCHATYGTDGFPTALVTLEHRDEVSEVAGIDVEALVYFYASCDRAFVYPRLRDGQEEACKDRFTGETFEPDHSRLRDFVDLTLANEADVGLSGARPAAGWPEWLSALFGDLGHLASPSVRAGFGQLMVDAGVEELDLQPGGDRRRA
ncbi:MAG TPA: hypothetical protein VHD39_05525 [Acidimicrobiales bacterium]|nr:hypothetical protein [Acidimicrobiales bacterium]